MKFIQAHIYGFGKWVDHQIHFTEENYVCLYGENESGKSTLKNFILFMLFGFPPRKRKGYQPKMSSRMGGRLQIHEADIGNYTIERLDGIRNGAAICYLPNGEERDEKWLIERLDGMTATIYEAIFSFSALDLMNIKQMKDDDLGEILLNIGLTGYNNIYEIEQQLQRDLDGLFKPYGKIPVINEQLNILDESQAQLSAIQNEVTTYRDQRLASEKLWEELNQLHSQLQSKQKSKLAIEKHINSLPLIHDYFAYKRQLDSLPKKLSFPEKGIERLRLIQEQSLPVKSEYSVLVDREKQLNEYIEQTEHQLLDTLLYEEAKKVAQNRLLYRRNEDELHHVKQKINKLHFQITNQLDQLQIGLELEDLAKVHFPFHIEQQWTTYKQTADELDQLHEEVTREHHTLRKQYNNLVSDLEQIQTDMLSEEQREQMEQKLSQLNQHREQTQLHKEAMEKQKQWDQVKRKKQTEQTTILFASIGLSLLSGVIAYFANSPFLYNVMILIILLGCFQWFWGKRSLHETDQLIATPTKIAAAPMSEAEEKMIEQRLTQDDKLKESHLSAEQEIHQIELKLHSLTKKKVTIQQDREKLEKQVADQQYEYPFLNNVAVTYWPELFHPVRYATELYQELIDLKEKVAKINTKQQQLKENIDQFLKKVNHESLELAVFKKFELIQELIQSHQDGLRQIRQYQEELQQNKQKQSEQVQRITTYNDQIASLFAIAQVETEEEFYARETEYTHLHQTKDALKKVKEQLCTVFSKAEMAYFHQEEKRDQTQLKLQHEKVDEQIHLLTSEIDEKREQQAELQATLEKMETSETFSKATHRYELEKDKLNIQAKKWAVIKTARDVLEETKRSYRNDYLTEVIDYMTIFFKQLTGNRYVNVFAPTEKQVFQVESSEGIRYTANELSQGTIDQLYVSLRIAMGQLVSNEHNIPFIIDDAFVHFDSIRLKRMLDLITSVANDQQVLLFTCKKEIKDYFMSDQIVYLEKSEQQFA